MCSSNLPDPSENERQLRQQLAAVVAAPVQSAARAKAMSRLLRTVMGLPGIKRVNHQDYSLALNQTWEWMSRNIDKFKSSTGCLEDDLVRWINGYLYWRIYNIYRGDPTSKLDFSLDAPVCDDGETYLDLLSVEGFIDRHLNTIMEQIQLLQQQEDRKIADKIEAWIHLDPDRKLHSCYPRNRDYCNCRILSYRLLLKKPPDSFTKISTDLNIPYQTLVSHWKRSCLPLLQNQAKIFGYQQGDE